MHYVQTRFTTAQTIAAATAIQINAVRPRTMLGSAWPPAVLLPLIIGPIKVSLLTLVYQMIATT